MRSPGKLVALEQASLPIAVDAPLPGSAGVAARLLELEAQYGKKHSLARLLRSPHARRECAGLAATGSVEAWRASPLGRPGLESLWHEVGEINRALLQLKPSALRALCAQQISGQRGAGFVADLLIGPAGARARAMRETPFLDDRTACASDPTRERAQALALALPGFVADLSADLRCFRRALRELHVLARAPLAVHTFGFGEISRPVGLVRRASPFASTLAPAALVYKPLAPFARSDLADAYVRIYEEYNRRLRDEAGIAVPAFGHRRLRDRRGRPVVFTTQAALDARAIGKAVLLQRETEQCLVLCRMVLAEYRKLVRYNNAQRRAGFRLGIDGQITNWALRRYRGDGVPLRGDEGLFYIDTNTPMMRMAGVDCLPLSFYLQGVPRVLRLLARPMAKKVLDRYFDPRTLVLDFLANTSIHGRGDLVDAFLREGNAFLAEGLIIPAPRPISREDVERYIANDVATWRLSRSMRALEEMLQRRRGPLQTVRHIYRIYTQPIF